MEYLMGLDVGTSGVKVVIINREGVVVSSDTEEYPLFTPRPGWAEQNPSDWWSATVRSIKKTTDRSPSREFHFILGSSETGALFPDDLS